MTMKRYRLLAVLFLLIGLANVIRAALVPQVLPVLDPDLLSLPLPLLGGVYGLFGLAFTALAVLLWIEYAVQLTRPLAVIYQLTLWIIRLVGYRSPFHRALWVRDLLFTTIFLIVVFILARPDSRGRKSER